MTTPHEVVDLVKEKGVQKWETELLQGESHRYVIILESGERIVMFFDKNGIGEIIMAGEFPISCRRAQMKDVFNLMIDQKFDPVKEGKFL